MGAGEPRLGGKPQPGAEKPWPSDGEPWPGAATPRLGTGEQRPNDKEPSFGSGVPHFTSSWLGAILFVHPGSAVCEVRRDRSPPAGFLPLLGACEAVQRHVEMV